MEKRIKILYLEDSLKDFELMHSIIESGEIKHKYFLTDNEKDFVNILNTENIDVILSDYNLPDYSGNEALKVSKEKYSSIPFIFVSGAIGEDAAINAMLNGATDYVFKNKLERLVPAIKRAVSEKEQLTERKQAEAELIKANEEKEKRAEELIIANKELTQLIQLNSDKNRFISILSHDLRGPFNNLLGLSEVLIEDIRKLSIDEIEDIVIMINESAKSSFILLENILSWSRAQQGKIPFDPRMLSFMDICKDAVEVLKPIAKAKNIKIDYSTGDHIYIYADIDMVKTVLRNLVSNAIKYTNNNGSISITAKLIDSKIQISVSDNGLGISPDNLSKLFEISEVLSTKGTAGETGTGLGLLLCKEFVEKNGGKIWVESEVGKGSEFRFTLPLSAETNDVNVVKNVVASDGVDSNITNLKILITDDDEASRRMQ